MSSRLATPLLLAACAVLLVIWPSAASAFHEPKRWLFAAVALGAVLLTLGDLRRWNVAALPLVVVTTLRPSIEALAFAWALVALPAVVARTDRARLVDALTWTGVLAAGVVLLQALGVDPLAAFHPDAPGTRLSRYGTLGNPDFVASALLPIAVLCAPDTHANRGAPLRLLLLAGALAAAQSLATVLGAGLAVLAWLAHRRSHDPLAPATGGGKLVVAAALLLVALPLLSRDVATTTRGRAYLVAVALPHVLDAPLLGQGAGVVVERWPAWELETWQARCADAACVEAHPEGRFTGAQDHVHADWLEVLLERGLLGLAALGLALGAALRTAWRSPRGATVFAALVAALSRTLVDFPLARPADLCVLALLVAFARAPDAPSPGV